MGNPKVDLAVQSAMLEQVTPELLPELPAPQDLTFEQEMDVTLSIYENMIAQAIEREVIRLTGEGLDEDKVSESVNEKLALWRERIVKANEANGTVQ